MKKNIGFVNLDASLLTWLMNRLRMAPEDVLGADEFREALEELAVGTTSSLMLEAEESDAIPVLTDCLQCGELLIYTKSHRVVRGGNEVSLTPKEFDILYFLAKNRGEVFTKEQIYQAVWSNEYLLDDSNIMAFIRKLRKKIEPNPDAPQYILTIWGIGYKFADFD